MYTNSKNNNNIVFIKNIKRKKHTLIKCRSNVLHVARRYILLNYIQPKKWQFCNKQKTSEKLRINKLTPPPQE